MEYSFFNPVPEFMNEELNISSCSELESLYNNTDNNYTSKRGLQSGIGNNSNTDYEIGIDEIIINEQVDWTKTQTQIIDELQVKRDNDVCYIFSTPENIPNIPANVDMFPQERKLIFYIDEAICEKGCKQIGYDKETSRVVCKCKIKSSTEGFESVTFSSNEKDEKFKKKINWPI